ncbi:glycosyl hydrolase family 28-related protein [Geodermatophilus sp. SYSU D01180]
MEPPSPDHPHRAPARPGTGRARLSALLLVVAVALGVTATTAAVRTVPAAGDGTETASAAARGPVHGSRSSVRTHGARAGARTPAAAPSAPSSAPAPAPSSSSAPVPPSSPSAPSPAGQPAPAGVSVAGYGARGDGRADDAPAIRAALAANQHVYIPAGTYLLASFESPRQTRLHADFVFSLRSGQTVTADPGAVLRFADGVIVDSPTLWGGNLFMVDGQSDVTISGGTWDFNGARNLVRPGQTITGYGVYTYGARNVTVQDVTMQDTPGQNYVVMQGRGEGFRVLRSTFRNGGTSLPANRNQVDFSAMYFTGADVTVDQVHVTHDQQPWSYAGGVELHGTRNAVTNSTIEKSWPGVYVGPDVASRLEVMEDTVVTGNRFLEVGRALVFNAEGTGAIDGVEFSGNTVHTTSFPALGAGRGVDQDAPPDGNWTYHHLITGLDVRDNDFFDDDGRTDSGIRLSQIHSGTITQNRFHQFSGAVLRLGGSPWGTRGVTFADNTATWLGSSGVPAITLSFTPHDADGITIARNRVTRTTGSGSACGVYLEGAAVTSTAVTGNTFASIGLPTCGPDAARLAYSA